MAAELPKRVDICPWGFFYASGEQAGTYARAVNTGALSGGHLSHSVVQTGAGTYREWKVLLGAGTWTLNYMHQKAGGAGIIDVSIDGVVVDNDRDFYNASSSYNNVADVTGISVASSGVKTLRFEVVGKNASATNYHMALHWIVLKRTA